MSATLFYVHDPMCSWCWGFRPALQHIREHLPAAVKLTAVVGGLAPDSDAPMPEETKRYVQQNWQNIERVIPGTPFNYDFWRTCKPRRSTYPACRAVIAACQLDPALEFPMIEAIQQAYYLHAKNPSDASTLIALAEDLGLDKTTFEKVFASSEVQQLLEHNLRVYQELAMEAGISGFPSLALKADMGLVGIPIDYNDASVSLDAINNCLGA